LIRNHRVALGHLHPAVINEDLARELARHAAPHVERSGASSLLLDRCKAFDCNRHVNVCSRLLCLALGAPAPLPAGQVDVPLEITVRDIPLLTRRSYDASLFKDVCVHRDKSNSGDLRLEGDALGHHSVDRHSVVVRERELLRGESLD